MNLKLRLILLLSLIIGPASATFAANQVFKIATLAPQGSDWMNRIEAGASAITAETEGRVKFKFFAGGIQGSDKKVLRKMRNGQLHGGAFPGSSLVSRTNSVLLYGLPFLFNDQSEVDAVRAELDQTVEDNLRESGLVTFGFAGGGFAQIMSNNPVRGLQDLKGKRVWVPEGDTASYRGLEHFGLAPVVLPLTDVLTGLQTGLIDVIGSSAIAALVLQWHTKVSHLSTMPVSYIYGVMAIEQKHFDKISEADQLIVDRVFRQVYIDLEQQGESDSEQALAALVGSGMVVTEPSPGALEDLQSRSRALWKSIAAESGLPKSELDQVYSVLEKLRN